jgi:hypothetical protein
VALLRRTDLQDRAAYLRHQITVDRGLERSGDWEWDNDRYPEYRTIESRNGYYSPSEGHAELWDRIKPLHFESIGKAANQTTMDPRTPKGHTPEILSYIRKELGRQISDNPELCAF